MKVISCLFKRAVNGALILALIGIPEMASAQTPAASDQKTEPVATPASAPQEPATNSNSVETGTGQQTQPQSNELPNSPGTVQPQSSGTTQSAQPRQSGSTERPLGTAAAEIGNASGTAASKPAGVAIAPAKQRQSRSLLIKLGAVIGVGVAVGTVMALSNASPSRPPGAP